jgi:hypothetical protein
VLGVSNELSILGDVFFQLACILCFALAMLDLRLADLSATDLGFVL